MPKYKSMGGDWKGVVTAQPPPLVEKEKVKEEVKVEVKEEIKSEVFFNKPKADVKKKAVKKVAKKKK